MNKGQLWFLLLLAAALLASPHTQPALATQPSHAPQQASCLPPERQDYTFCVTSTADADDASPGDGVCQIPTADPEQIVCSLRAAIREANALPGLQKIYLKQGAYVLSRAGDDDSAVLGDLDITGDLVLTGAGVDVTILNGQQTDRLFHVLAGATATIEGMLIRNGATTGEGGAIFNAGTLALSSIDLRENRATLDGGGILNIGTLTINSSYIYRNVAEDTPSDGGGIANRGTLTLADSTVEQNAADEGGGILSAAGSSLTLTSSSVLRNQAAPGSGGGISAYGELSITGGSVQSNTAQLCGGGVSTAGEATLTVTFTQNSAACGGALYNTGRLRLVASSLERNTAGGGGGVLNTGTLIISGGRLSDNSDSAIENRGSLSVNGAQITGNTGTNGAGIFNSDGAATVSNTTLAENEASGPGGGIYSTAPLDLRSSTATGNTASTGGGVASTAPMTITASRVISNTASSGGGVFSEGTLLISGSAVLSNTVTGSGGGVRNSGPLTISGSTVGANQAASGGGIDNIGVLAISASTISANTTSGDGGGIRNGGVLTATNITVSGNAAGGSGGGIEAAGPAALLTNVTIAANTADADTSGVGDGGGVVIRSTGVLSSVFSIIAANTDASGDADPRHPDCSGTLGLLGGNIVGDIAGGACAVIANSAGGEQIGDSSAGGPLDPLLGPLSDNGGPTLTHALLPGSPALDAITGGVCPATDQRGVPRPYGAGCDVGAFEEAPAPRLLAISPSTTTAGKPGFTLTVTGANFALSTLVRWNGDDRPTTFVSPTELRATIPATDLASPGSVEITVFDPATGLSGLDQLTLTITPAPEGLVIYMPLVGQ